MDETICSINIKDSERLSYELLGNQDADLIYALRSDERVVKYTGIKKYNSMEEAMAYIGRVQKSFNENSAIVWSIWSRSKEMKIGTICLWNYSKDMKKAEIGYDLIPDCWGFAFAAEAIRALTEKAFMDMGFETIEALPVKENERSRRVLEKSGFEFEEDFTEDGIIFSKYSIKTKGPH